MLYLWILGNKICIMSVISNITLHLEKEFKFSKKFFAKSLNNKEDRHGGKMSDNKNKDSKLR